MQDERGRGLLLSLLDDMEGMVLSGDRREMRCLEIREHLGLCNSGGCHNPRLADTRGDGYCSECLDFD